MTLTVGLSRQTATGMYRLDHPVKHGDDWISPFIAETPHQADSKDHKKITIKDETGYVEERYFKIIDTTHWRDPITLDNKWPNDPKELYVASCCHTAYKANELATSLLIKPECPNCREPSFVDPLGTTYALPAPALPAPALPAPALPAPALPAPALPAPAHNVLTGKIGNISFITGYVLLTASVAINSATKLFLLTSGVSIILMGTGITLLTLSRINPQNTLIVKIRTIGKSVLEGAAITGLGALILASAKYTTFTPLIIAGSGAFITTIASAVLYAKFIR